MNRFAAATIAGCAVVTTLACGGNNNDSAMGTRDDQPDRSVVESNGRDADVTRQPVTLTGCLQEGGGVMRQGYLLTMLNEPAATVGTSGSVTTTGSSVEREQMRIASRTYRLEPDNDVELKPMLGKQVRVTGHVTEQAEAPNGKGAIGTDSDTQRPNRDVQEQERRGVQMNTSDLAKLEVTSASVVSESCGDDSRQPNR